MKSCPFSGGPGLLFLGLCLVSCAPALIRAENLVPNPGFESATTGWHLLVPNGSEKGSPEFSTVAADPHSGQMSAMTSATGFVRYALAPQEAVVVAPGERYRLSAWVRYGSASEAKEGMPQVYLRAMLGKDATHDVSDPRGHIHVGLSGEVARAAVVGKLAVKDQDQDPGWRKIEGVIEIPDDTTRLLVNLFIHGVNGKVYWDDVLLEKVEPDTPLSPEVVP